MARVLRSKPKVQYEVQLTRRSYDTAASYRKYIFSNSTFKLKVNLVSEF